VDGEKEESPTSPVKIPRPDFDLNSLERSSTRHQALSVWDSDEVSIAAIALFALGVLVWYNGYAGESAGRAALRGRRAVIINVDGKDYAVNGMGESALPSN